ncbi:helix-turn-helix transcriptional regulator [Candidatus Gracilibacteria bacterium]|nr:helix-turn-helix transcriptional regulator [Candidatus Gracilibacteria bacterium]NJM89460.1 helix-turn-helix transcriptional regulator [Hydrococcus sp. RU_2_2]NJP18596.1 helix-turn-helix transcriptional regulator [Hydrococcus sp. CRU_1_1]NJQ98094.1 helix-turn-helix transcriptional regulator [Hydrococcus sp. CSU_1_8]
MNEATFSNPYYESQLAQVIKSNYNKLKLSKSQFEAILSKNNLKLRLKSELIAEDTAYDSAIGHLQINGQSYAIVRVKNAPNPIQSHLTKILTERELQVAALVALGHSNQQVADRLKVSEWSISTHLRRIFVKLGVTNRTAMISRCASLSREVSAPSLSTSRY